MRVRGEVFSGAARGTPLIEKYYPRLIGLIGFRPFKGTLDVRLERSIDIRPFSSKTIDHVLMDGRKKVNAYLARVKIRKFSKLYSLMEVRTKEKEIIDNVQKMENVAEEKFSIKSSEVKEAFHECWAIQFKNGIYGNDIVEIICDCMLKEKLGLSDGDIVEVEFKEKDPGKKNKRSLPGFSYLSLNSIDK